MFDYTAAAEAFEATSAAIRAGEVDGCQCPYDAGSCRRSGDLATVLIPEPGLNLPPAAIAVCPACAVAVASDGEHAEPTETCDVCGHPVPCDHYGRPGSALGDASARISSDPACPSCAAMPGEAHVPGCHGWPREPGEPGMVAIADSVDASDSLIVHPLRNIDADVMLTARSGDQAATVYLDLAGLDDLIEALQAIRADRS